MEVVILVTKVSNNSEVIILESRIKIVENRVGACIARQKDHRGIASLALQRNVYRVLNYRIYHSRITN